MYADYSYMNYRYVLCPTFSVAVNGMSVLFVQSPCLLWLLFTPSVVNFQLLPWFTVYTPISQSNTLSIYHTDGYVVTIRGMSLF